MGIYQKGANWYVDYYVQGHRKRKKIGPSKKLADQVLKDIQVKIAKREFLNISDEKKILFEDYAKEYLEYSKANKSHSMYERRDKVSLNQLTPFLKGYFLCGITPQMIERYKVMRLNTVQPATVNRELACLKHMYTKALEWGYARINPTKGIKLLKEPPGRLRYLEPKEAELLISKCSLHLRPIVVMALNTGMRRNEILRLKWENVNIEYRKIQIINSKNNQLRVIPINNRLYQELNELYKQRHGVYVFEGSNGMPYKDIKTAFHSALRRAEIENFHFHDLRHTFGSQLVMSGVDLRTVQQLLGHKDIKMTIRYSHLSPVHVQEAVNKLDSTWTPYRHRSKNVDNKIDVTI